MPVALKSRIGSALLFILMLAPLTDARSVDAPLHKVVMPFSRESEAAPRREARLLSRREIFQVIQSDLAQRGVQGRGGLQPGDLTIQSTVPVLRDDVGLEVRRVGFDPIRRETVFELWTSLEPQYLPFEVTTRRDPRSWGVNSELARSLEEADGGLATGSPAVDQRTSRARSNGPALAKPGRPATLVMLGQNVRITTTVVPLQPGTKGQCILVRDLATAQVMKAEVVDEGLLRTSF